MSRDMRDICRGTEHRQRYARLIASELVARGYFVLPLPYPFPMYEFLLVFSLSYLFLSRKKRKRKPRGLDEELKELITQSSDATSVGLDIKRYLLNTINENNHDREKFTDAQLAEAQRILDRAGPSAFYWMSDIAAQFAVLAAAQANGIPTNVGEKLGSGATAEAIVDVVVQV